MFIEFFLILKTTGLPVSLREFLTLLEALAKEALPYRVESFYYLSRTILVKHEQYLDRFDQIFGAYFKGIEEIDDALFLNIPEEWLRQNAERMFSEEEKAMIEAMGGLDKLMERLRELLDEQEGRHEGGNKWVGTGGTSPFGAFGYNPEGIRIGGESRQRRAVKIWEKREFKNLDDKVELNTRNMKMALKRLRILTREGRPEEIDVNGSIRRTSENGGMLELEMVPSRRNNVKVLLLLDVGGSMDDHIETCSQLFSAAKYEFKHLEYFYFHNCVYEQLWKDNMRRRSESVSTYEVLRTFNRDYKVIFVGDAAMSPYELTYPGGSVEYRNEEAGMVWLQRIKDRFPDMVWLNPLPVDYWEYYESLSLIQRFMDYRMFPLSLGGLAAAMKALKNRKLAFKQG